MEEWATVGRHFKAVEKKYMSREHERVSVMERIIINADDDDTSEFTVSYDDNDDTQGVGLIVSDSE
jgi:hypothetical protein